MRILYWIIYCDKPLARETVLYAGVKASEMRDTVVESHFSSSVISRPMGGSLSPALVSPPTINTPPPAIGKRHTNTNTTNAFERAQSEPNANAPNQPIQNFEDSVRLRERTPGGSPSRKRQRVYGDRSVGILPFFSGSTKFFFIRKQCERDLTDFWKSPFFEIECHQRRVGLTGPTQIHSESRPRFAIKLQSDTICVSNNAFKSKEADSSWRSQLPKE